ncbi:MAG: ATP-binding protein [Ghiorsea sp.]
MQYLSWIKGLAPYLVSNKKAAPEKQEALVSSTLFIGSLFFPIFVVANYAYGFYTIAIAEFVLFLVYLVCLLAPNDRLSMETKGALSIAGTVVLMLMLYCIGGIENSGIFWLPLLPFLVFTMTGVRKAWVWLCVFILGIITIQIASSYEFVHVAYTGGQTAQFFGAFFVYTILAFIFEVVRVQSWDEMQAKNLQLEQIRGTLSHTLNNLETEVSLRTSELEESNQLLKREIDNHRETNQVLSETEQKFYQAQKMEALGTLVGGLAHDFNNALSSIGANLFAIQREIKGNDLVQDKLDDVERMVFHASDMSQQLLTFARKDKVEKKRFDMHSFINEGIKLGVAALPSRIKVEKHISASALPISGSTTQLQQVTMNLLNNARDALSTKELPVIRVSLMRLDEALTLREKHPSLEGDWLYLCVADNGCGISEDNLSQVFDPFFTTKEVGQGTGLGLAMCYGAIQSHGGSIEIESTLDMGSSIHIYLPLAKNGSVRKTMRTFDDKLIGQGETVLFVDEDSGFRNAHQNVLEQLNYKVLLAQDGLEAIKTYTSEGNKIDLIVIDTLMSNMGGCKAAQYIFSMNKDVKIIFTSNHEQEAATKRWVLENAKELEAVKYLNKPFGIEELCKMIRAGLDLPH